MEGVVAEAGGEIALHTEPTVHSGSVTLAPAPGGGTLATLTLPVAPDDAGADAPELS
ncbi:hypothetical protein [Nocardia tengchongensis]